jgi:hypothetical protein
MPLSRFEQLELLLETWPADELLNELVRFLPAATFDEFYDDAAVEDDGEDYDDSMDGDHGSALASCGWGTDEDYGGGDCGYDEW